MAALSSTTGSIEPGEPVRYHVVMIGLDGSRKVVPVITDRGPLKAVYLASATLRTTLGRSRRFGVDVEVVGPVEFMIGPSQLDGYIFDRQEW